MAKHLYIQKAAKLAYADNSIFIIKEGGEKPLVFSLEDIDIILLEDKNCVITSALLAELGENGVSLIICGKDYLPKSQVIPLNYHYKKSSLLKLQQQLLPYKKKKLWEAIVKQKIKNQAAVLSTTSNDELAIERLNQYRLDVKPGDETNMEGAAAREYFSSLFGKSFIRFSDNPISSALNYGYGIIASSVIRAVACAGLEDNIGIWHDSEQNSSNLSYDLIEPFRQIVDLYVFNNRTKIEYPLSHEIKVGMISLLNEEILIDNKSAKLCNAIEIFVNEFVEYLKSGDITKVSLPIFNPAIKEDKGEENE